MRKAMSCILTIVLLATTASETWGNSLPAFAPSGAPTRKQTAMKERLLAVSPGTMIEVRLRNGQKMRGRLGEFSDEGFMLTTIEKQKVVKEKIAFAEMKSFRKVEGGKAGRRVLWMLAGVGALVLILSVVVLARGDD